MKRAWLALPVLLAAALAWPGASFAKTVLDVAVPSNLNTLDPAKTKIGEEYNVVFLVFSGLTEIDRNMKLQPDLATSWEHSADLKSWTFHLRQGVKFHNGEDFTAEDVIATVNHIRDKSVGSPARVNFEIVQAMKAPDPHTIEFTLSTPYGGFPDIFGDRQARILPHDKIDSIATTPIGTGPFKFVSFMPGDKVVLAKNPSYYKQGEPKLDGVVFHIMPEAAARMTALETGQIDLMWDVPLELLKDVQAKPGIAVDSVSTSTWDGIIMRDDEPPFNDVRVRQAVALAVDAQKMVDLVLFGNGTPTHSPIPPASPYYNNDLPPLKPDIAAAKKLLAEAGHPDGFEVSLYVPEGRASRERLGVAMREFLKPIGITVNIQRVPWDQFIKEIEGKAKFYTDGFYSRPTVDTSLYPWYASTGSWNTTLWHFKSAEIDKVLDAARQSADEAERTKLYKEFQALAVKEVPGVVPYVLNHANAYRKELYGFHSTPMMWLDLRDVAIGG
ncbi:MAG: ABC transporter substrate-binding protein [Alphaproteobacteria bacterium]